MNDPTTGGVITLGVSLGICIGTYICIMLNDGFTVKNKLIFISTVQTSIFPVAMIPQIIVNQNNEDVIEKYYSPFFLMAYPASVTLDIFNQVTMKKHGKMPPNGIATFFGMMLRLFFYIIWLAQFAISSQYFWIAVVFFICIMILFVYAFLKKEDQPQTNDLQSLF